MLNRSDSHLHNSIQDMEKLVYKKDSRHVFRIDSLIYFPPSMCSVQNLYLLSKLYLLLIQWKLQSFCLLQKWQSSVRSRRGRPPWPWIILYLCFPANLKLWSVTHTVKCAQHTEAVQPQMCSKHTCKPTARYGHMWSQWIYFILTCALTPLQSSK